MATINIADMAITWNAGGTTFNGIKLNITDTASAAGSKLIDLLVGGVSFFNVAKTGVTVVAGEVRAPGFWANANNSVLYFGTAADLALQRGGAAGVMLLSNGVGDFGRLQFGGTTSSFPALKRSTTGIQDRLADDSDFGFFQAKLRTHAAAVAATPTATHTMVIEDAGGTAYRVLCVV